MATQDISRYLHQPQKHYTTVHLQQGRVIVDSDWNERAAAEAEDLRETVLDLVCSHGTPNDGFAVSNVTGADPDEEITVPDPTDPYNYPDTVPFDTYDFELGAGSFYVGGLRVAVDDPVGYDKFLSQPDWLQLTATTNDMPARVPGGGPARTDLVYMQVWEQPVTAVEDSELLDPALGGRDTSVRIKRMRRFIVKTGVGSTDCVAEFGNLMVELEQTDKADFDAETGELVSAARLEVLTNSNGVEEDLCADPTTSGYVGAENQTIRVELREGSKLIWGYDNASKLYRVQIDETDGVTVKFLTPPEDLPSYPREGQVVEILPWGAILPNGEKVAEAQGFVTTVASAYDHFGKEMTLTDAIDLRWLRWLELHPEHYNDRDDSSEQQYLYLRVWDRGADHSSAAEIGYTAGNNEIELGETGLSIKVRVDGLPGDYWIIAARPSTPDIVAPWDLVGTAPDYAAPHGPRMFYAPLAIIDWDNSSPSQPTVHDCRAKLRQLCEGGCCTVTVGDGTNSFGQVSTLQDAIDMVSSGDKICVLPGIHEGNALIDGAVSGLTNVVIEGCGARSMLINPKPATPSTDFQAFETSVIKLKDCSDITLKDLNIYGYSAVGVEIVEDTGTCRGIKLDNLKLTASGNYQRTPEGSPTTWELPAPTITVAAASEVEIVDCKIDLEDVLSYSFAVVLGGEYIRMKNCVVTASSSEDISSALSGIHVRSCSRKVEIIGCEVDGGWGHGIALGHGRFYEDASGLEVLDDVLRDNVTAGTSESSVPPDEEPDDCGPSQGVSPNFDSVPGQKFLPGGPVEDIRIYDNHIHNMGLSGISTTLWWPADVEYEAATGPGIPRFIVTTDVDIARNVIEDNAKLPLPPGLFTDFDIAVGGVCLAASVNAWIHENTIRRNGRVNQLTPICGVGMTAAMNAVIEDNQIVENGVEWSNSSSVFGAPNLALRGLRGGIAIWEATMIRTQDKIGAGEMPTFPTGTSTEIPPEGTKDWTDASSQSAVVVRGNEVDQLMGKALWIRRGFGPIAVTGNTLEGRGEPVAGVAVLGSSFCWKDVDAPGQVGAPGRGACVEIINYGKALDVDWTGITAEEVSWTDASGGEVDDGMTEVSGNSIRLTWPNSGVFGASVVVSTLGSALFSGNTSVIELGSTYDPQSPSAPMTDFYVDMLTEADTYDLAIFNVFVGAMSTGQANSARMTEGPYDCLFSCVVGPPLAPVSEDFAENKHAAVLVGNVGTHAVFGGGVDTGATVIHDWLTVNAVNAVVHKHESYTTLANWSVSSPQGSTRVICVEYDGTA